MKRLALAALACLLVFLCSLQVVPVLPAFAEEGTAPEEADAFSGVADASQMTTVEDVVEEGMVPVFASSLKDGVYSIGVDSSSSMFRITACSLTVSGEEMQAKLTMSGTSYTWLYPGTALEASRADRGTFIPYEEDESGAYTFVLPVEALDQGIPCAAYSKNKQLWYDRTLVFRADSLPLDAFAPGFFTTPESLALSDGEYTVEVTLAGGSGRAKVSSPARLTVRNGACTAEIVWGSKNYDYMKVDDIQYFPINEEGNSAFEIPVSIFDRPMPVIADTVAMSQPHEIEYKLTVSVEK